MRDTGPATINASKLEDEWVGIPIAHQVVRKGPVHPLDGLNIRDDNTIDGYIGHCRASMSQLSSTDSYQEGYNDMHVVRVPVLV
uniref:Uncharacterized protein n=1 Tax=Peronospora matthiolae TaxID=2874970 RepID=A0AAV1V3Y2_9STRA